MVAEAGAARPRTLVRVEPIRPLGDVAAVGPIDRTHAASMERVAPAAAERASSVDRLVPSEPTPAPDPMPLHRVLGEPAGGTVRRKAPQDDLDIPTFIRRTLD
jgi:hypothetical protein